MSYINNKDDDKEIIKFKGKFNRQMFPKEFKKYNDGEFAILSFSVDEKDFIEGNVKENVNAKYNTISVKGNFPYVNSKKQLYTLLCEVVEDPQWGKQCQLIMINEDLDLNNIESQKIFLKSAELTDKQIVSLYTEFDNPMEFIKNGNIEELCKVKGIGEATAKKMITKVQENEQYAEAYVTLNSYGMTPHMIRKLSESYGSPITLVNQIKENPYMLTRVDGIGFKKADDMALASGMDKFSQNRLCAFITHVLNEGAEQGYSWISSNILVNKIEDELDYFPIEDINKAVTFLKHKKVIWDGERGKVALLKIHQLEQKICTELLRINNSENKFEYKNIWVETLNKTERIQGWEFTLEQREGILTVLENQVSMVTGLAGTGKSSIVSGMINILKNYGYVQTALSGRASSRMAEITGEKGYTIHRLLGMNPETGGFLHNSENLLPHDIYIVDEISMVGGYLFYDLIQAIPTGAKLIVLGDVNQLEAIGVMNLAKDILDSEILSSVRLSKIHRQGLKSAIKTESKKIIDNVPLFEGGWVGHEIRGEYQDFELDVYNDREISVKKCRKYFKKYLPQASSIMEIQILVPVKERGDCCVFNLNNNIQNIFNPFDESKNEVEVSLNKKLKFTLREGDKVMIMKNNYNTKSDVGKDVSIFNGQQGIIETIDLEYELIYLRMPSVCEDLIIVGKEEWTTINLGYACTVAKSQGSQYEYVIGCIDYSTPPIMLVKELAYTLVTRASKHLVLCGESRALRKCLETSFVSQKQTFLKDMLDSKNVENSINNKVI